MARAPARDRALSGIGEAETVRRAAQGDLAAFTELVHAHEAALRRYTRRLAGDDGNDLAQETLLAAWRALGQWRGKGTLASWLRTIATRKFLDQRRSAAGRVRFAQLDDGDLAAHEDSTEQRIGLQQALALLAPRERAAALLVFAEGHSHTEAAEILQLPLGTLKTLIARARAALVPLLDGDQP